MAELAARLRALADGLAGNNAVEWWWIPREVMDKYPAVVEALDKWRDSKCWEDVESRHVVCEGCLCDCRPCGTRRVLRALAEALPEEEG